MARYYRSFHTIVSAHETSYGFGGVLVQQQPAGEERTVAFASRPLIVTETRYSETEKEALALKWDRERFDQFVRGVDFHVHTDPRFLFTFLGSAELDFVPRQIQSLGMRIPRSQFKVLNVPEKPLATADILSHTRDTQKYHNYQVGPPDVELFERDIVKTLE